MIQLGQISLPQGFTPEMVMAAAGAVSTAAAAMQELAKTGFTLHVDVKLPPSGEFLARALPPAIITTAFITATVFLIGAGVRYARKPHQPRAAKLRPAVSGLRRRRR